MERVVFIIFINETGGLTFNKCQGERVALIGASPLLFRNTKNTETKFVEHNMLLQVCIVYDVLH